MGQIRLLSDQLINRIAAGEVVERPAAALKELIENSLDAGASRIEIDIEAGGRRRIAVSDNGQGMGPDDLLLAIERHATSKLAEETDLLNIATLGFRGEALPSIGAVSRLTVTSAPGQDGRARRVRLAGGRLLGAEDAARDQGTTVEVDDLFYNVPARRKFLKSIQTEAAHVLETIERYALARPDLRLIYRHDGREILATSPREDQRSRLARVLGPETARGLRPFEGQAGVYQVDGFLGRPEMDRGRGDFLYLFVNGRPVKDRLLTRAVLEAYRGRLAAGRFPAALVRLTLPSDMVDVNVHPAKIEVRFRRPQEVLASLVEIIGQALGITQSALPRPEPQEYRDGSATPTAVRESGPAVWGQNKLWAARPVPWSSEMADKREPWVYVPGRSPEEQSELRAGHPASDHQTTDDTEYTPGPAASREPDRSSIGLRAVGQLFASYILAQGPDGLYVLDQHAAHERVLFERLTAELLSGPLSSQGLLVPETMEATPTQAAALEDLAPELVRYGFDLEHFGGGTFILRAIPAVLTGREPRAALEAIIEQSGEDERPDWAAIHQEVVASLACHGAIKAGQELTRAEMDRLLADLARCQVPSNCPHGRPLVFSLDRREIERRFKRL